MCRGNRLREQRRLIFTLIVGFVLLTSCKSISSLVSSIEDIEQNAFIVFDKIEFEQAKEQNIYPDEDKILAYHYRDTLTSFYVLFPILTNATLAIAKEKCSEISNHGGDVRLLNEEDINVQVKRDFLKKLFKTTEYNEFLIDKVINDSSVWGSTYKYSTRRDQIELSVRGTNSRLTGLCISDTELNNIEEVSYKAYDEYNELQRIMKIKLLQNEAANKFCIDNPSNECCMELSVPELDRKNKFTFKTKSNQKTRSREWVVDECVRKR